MSNAPLPPSLPRHDNDVFRMYLSGVLTAILTVVLVWYLDEYQDEYIMGWYGYFIVPVGPLLVGLLAGSGFAWVASRSGVKVSARDFRLITAILVVVYGASHYVQYQGLVARFGREGALASFATYFDFITRSLTFEGGQEATGMMPAFDLGIWGYLFRILELAAFTFGGALIPWSQSRRLATGRYCESCRRYMSDHFRLLLPGSAPSPASRSAQDAVIAQESDARARAEGQQAWEQLRAALASTDLATVDAAVAPHASKQHDYLDLPRRILARAWLCPDCGAGRATAVWVGRGRKHMPALGETPVTRDVGFALLPDVIRRRALRKRQAREVG